MPNKIPAHDEELKKRINRIPKVEPRGLARARKFRSSAIWQKVVKIQKTNYPLCCDPFKIHLKEGRSEFMDEVHHVRQLVTHWHLRAYIPNLRSICTACHHKISMMEKQGKPTYYLFRKS